MSLMYLLITILTTIYCEIKIFIVLNNQKPLKKGLLDTKSIIVVRS